MPSLLAGPVLRRTEPCRVCIWVATSSPLRSSAEVFPLSGGKTSAEPIGSGTGERVQLGPRLFVHLISVEPRSGDFPVDELLGYDLRLTGPDDEELSLGSLGLLDPDRGITYPGLDLPSFVITGKHTSVNLLHGSCRLLHGKGEDSLLGGDEVVGARAMDPTGRPCALFLTGDQIYADEVAGPLIGPVSALGAELMGRDDDGSVPGMPPLRQVPVYGRAKLCRERAGFTSDHADNHLMTFGEFAGMYLFSWGPELWPDRWPDAGDVLSDQSGRSKPSRVRWRRKFAGEVATLERARAALPAVRRLLANVPTYMIFDDHDTTDDWNLTQQWRDRVWSLPAGRRIVSNALAAFWAFQGWGNDPGAYDDAFKARLGGFLSKSGSVDGDAFDETLWSFQGWNFYVPTTPRTIFVDTRTQRSFDGPDAAARLIGAEGRERLLELIEASGHDSGDPLIIVSPVPVFGFELQERRQKYLVDKLGPYEIDFEAWHSNLQGFVDFMCLLIERLELPYCILLSGDVHYGFNANASFSAGDRELQFAQLGSSACKHAGELSKLGLDLLGRLVRARHERVGWNRPPRLRDARVAKRRLLIKPANTDEWAEDSPVFLNPNQARRLNIDEPPDYHETRTYVRPEGHGSSMLVGQNNLGLVSVGDAEVTHRLLARDESGTRTYTARFPITRER